MLSVPEIHCCGL